MRTIEQARRLILILLLSAFVGCSEEEELRKVSMADLEMDEDGKYSYREEIKPFTGIATVSKNGKLVSESHFVSGDREGDHKVWWPETGKMRSQATYLDGFMHGSMTTWNEEGVKLSESATWEDPKAIFKGPKEILQAFRIPTQDTIASARCVNVEPQGESIVLSYALPYQNDGDKSILVVTVEMHQMKDSPEFNEFVITKMEEQWNGIPLFQSMLFWIVRRVNGFAAFQLSSGLGW